MALPKEFMTDRMTNDTLGVDIDNRVADLEAVICDALGFTIDTMVTESPTGFDNSGRFTKALLRLKAAGPVGWRIYNSTNSKEFRLVLDGTNITVDENTGTESVPTWTNRASMALATGVWTFTGIPEGPASNPTTVNQLTRKAYVDGEITTLNNAVVHDTGDETVAGIKTFSSFPVTPSSAPSTDYQVANKKYVNDEVAGSGKFVKMVHAQFGGVATGTTLIPVDDTIPQNTEGTEFMTLAITPAASTNKLKVDVVFNFSVTGGQKAVTAALFKDTVADALAAVVRHEYVADYLSQIVYTCIVTAGTTSPITFKLRAGPHSAATVTFNGSGGARWFGGVMASSLTITELLP